MEKEEIIKNKISAKSLKNSYVYFLIDGSEIVYVGQTTIGTSRILAHCGNKKFDSYSLIPCPPEDLSTMESNYIYKFNPKYNLSMPLNDEYVTRYKLKKQYRVEGNALRRIMKLYNVNPNSSDCFKRSEIEEALQKAKKEGIIHYRPNYSNNNDWYLNT